MEPNAYIAQPAEPRPMNVLSVAIGSAVFPGFGQFLQHRYVTGALHLASVSAYAALALRIGSREWLIGALLFNAWSVIDAVWWSRGAGLDQDDVLS
jgi:hypothetical protein